MAQYFKDFGDNLRSGYHQLKKNKALKGIDDYFDKINAGGGEGLADFAVDMSGIADMYQVGKQGAHIADDLFREGKSWDEVDQGRKDAFERGAVGTALTLAPLPGIKTLGTAGKYATKGFTTAGRNVPGKALVGSSLPKVDKMRRRLEKAHKKAGTSLAPGLSDKAVGKTYRKFKDIPNEDGLRAAYSKLGGNADIIAPGIGKTRRAIRALGGVPLTKGWRSKFPQRAAAVAMKDWDWGEHPSGLNPFYRGEYAGQGANDTDVMEQIMGGAFPGQQGGLGKQGQEGTDGMGMSMNDYMEMGIDDPKLGEAISGGSLQAAAAAERLADIAQPDMPATRTSKPASLKDPAPTSVESGAPVFDPRINEFVRAESLTAEEREAFADATADAMKNLDPTNRVQTHDPETGDLRGPGSNWRQQLQRQLDQEKSLKKVQDGYRSERGREGARGSKGYDSSTDTEANNRPKPLSESEIQRQIAAHKVAQDNRDRGHTPTDQDILTAPDNPFREFYSDDYLNQLRRETRSDEDYREDTVAGEVPRHELENPAPDTSPIERLQDRQRDFNPEMPPLSEPRPIPDDALSFADKLAPHTANEIAKRDAGPEAAQEMQQSLQNLDLSPEIDAGQDLISLLDQLPGSEQSDAWDNRGDLIPLGYTEDVSEQARRDKYFYDNIDKSGPFSPEAEAEWEEALRGAPTRPSTNGTSTTIRDLNDPAPSSIENELMEGPGTPAPAQWEGELMEGPGTPAPAQWEGDLMPGEQDGPVPYAEAPLAGNPMFSADNEPTNYEKIFGDLKDEDGFGTDYLDLGLGGKASMRDFFFKTLSNPNSLGIRSDGQPETLQDKIDKLPSPYRERVMRMVAEGDL